MSAFKLVALFSHVFYVKGFLVSGRADVRSVLAPSSGQTGQQFHS